MASHVFFCRWDLAPEQEIEWTCDLAKEATLPPGAVTKCVGQHVLTQDNLDDGEVRSASFGLEL